jgi:predicted RNA-binding protein YlxR (DUF448 family)
MMLAHANSELDVGPRRIAPERLCVVTRAVRPVADMIRFVVGPDEAVVPDIKHRLPGRGVWVSASRAAVAAAVERKLFGRSFKREVRVSPDLVALTERLIERAALDALAIVHKAGRVAIGFAKVEAALASDAGIGLVHAAEASADGIRKIAAAAHRSEAKKGPLAVIDMFDSTQLGLALGRSNVVHAALLAGPASDGFLARCRSLERFRSEDGSVRDTAERRRKGGLTNVAHAGDGRNS